MPVGGSVCRPRRSPCGAERLGLSASSETRTTKQLSNGAIPAPGCGMLACLRIRRPRNAPRESAGPASASI